MDDRDDEGSMYSRAVFAALQAIRQMDVMAFEVAAEIPAFGARPGDTVFAFDDPLGVALVRKIDLPLTRIPALVERGVLRPCDSDGPATPAKTPRAHRARSPRGRRRS